MDATLCVQDITMHIWHILPIEYTIHRCVMLMKRHVFKMYLWHPESTIHTGHGVYT